MTSTRLAGLSILTGLLLWSVGHQAAAPPAGAPSPAIQPTPPAKPAPPAKPRRPWAPRSLIAATVGGPIAPDGTEVACDLPANLHIKNRGGSDGAGLCVFASLAHSCTFQHVFPLGIEDGKQGIFQWMWRYPGGGYPPKVDAKIAQMCQEAGVAPPRYVQVQSRDLEILKLACKTRRMPGVTYSFSPSGRYGGRRIAHMVSLVHADDKWFGILDNNFPGTIEWCSPAEFARAYTGGSQNGWSVIFLNPAPPPPPKANTK